MSVLEESTIPEGREVGAHSFPSPHVQELQGSPTQNPPE